MSTPDITLASGHAIPQLGLGTWMLRGQQCKDVVKEALELGYTHLDSAWMYENQDAIGQVLKEVGADRDRASSSPPRFGIRTWSTRRLWSRWKRFCAICRPNTSISCSSTAPVRVCRWSALWPRLKKSTRLARPRALALAILALSRRIELGLPLACRYAPIRWSTTCATTARRLRRHCHAHNVVLTAHRPLAQGELAKDEDLRQVAAEHGRTPAQVALKWLLQKDMIVIPKASSTAHLRDNLDLFDWQLGAEEMARLEGVGVDPD